MSNPSNALRSTFCILPNCFVNQLAGSVINSFSATAKLSRIADTLATQMPGPAGRNWGNVAFNLNPAMGSSQRVNRSYQR